MIALRIFGQATRVVRSHRAHVQTPPPGGFHSALLQRGQRAQPSVHAHPSSRLLDKGQPLARHAAQSGSGPSTPTGHAIAHLPQSLHSSATTVTGVGEPACATRIAPRGQAGMHAPHPSQPRPIPKLNGTPSRHTAAAPTRAPSSVHGSQDRTVPRSVLLTLTILAKISSITAVAARWVAGAGAGADRRPGGNPAVSDDVRPERAGPAGLATRRPSWRP